MTDEQKCLEWLKHRRDNMPMAGAKRMFGIAIAALEKQTCDGCIFNKRWEEDNCIDCARKAIDKYQRPLPEPYTEEES